MKFPKALCVLSVALAFTTAQAQVAAEETLRLEAVVPSPWGAPLGLKMPVGSTMRFGSHLMTAPAPLNCPGATHVFIRTPASGLFEGNLPPPAERSAAALGMPTAVITQRIGCVNASFDVHRASDGRAWIGLDNAVLQWSRVSVDNSPEATVEMLLIQQFADYLPFSTGAIAAQSTLLTESLVGQFNRWFVRTQSSDEVPELNGDPFTDSQEYPDGFELAAARVTGDRAEITVTYSYLDERMGEPYPVHMELMRVGQRWRVNDLRYRGGRRLSELLEH